MMRHDAVAVCGLFDLMNRLVEGLGITAGEHHFQISARRLAEIGYEGLQPALNRCVARLLHRVF